MRATGALSFRLLGSLEVWQGEHQLTLGGKGQRTVLALLLLQANQVVSTERLSEELWGEQPPPTARTRLHGLILQLRKLFEPAHVGSSYEVLITHPSGYLLRVAPDQLDSES